MSGRRERWAPLPDPDLDRYEVSDCGRVRNVDTGRILRHDLGNRGHRRVRLYRNGGGREMHWVHRLVLLAFEGEPIVLHRNDDPSDNRVANLRYGTRRENARDAVGNGRRPRGAAHPKARLTAAKVRLARELRAEGWTCARIAKRFGVTKATISAATRGDTWSHVA